MIRKFCVLISVLLLLSACESEPVIKEAEEEKVVMTSLPMNKIALDELSAFNTDGANWVSAASVASDFSKNWDLQFEPGSGILANNVKDEGKRNVDGAAAGNHIFSQMEHGDLELEFEVLVPKESNSGIYLQSRYELQIRDTAGDPDPSSDDMGGIYAQWKDPNKKDDAIGGSAPKINAARAAGLWQKLHVLFRAPKFDAQGKKIANAKFEKVMLNGFLIQENVEVTSPTIGAPFLDEVARAPFMIQGDHGPVAFRNLEYKDFGKNEVTLSDMTYKVYDGKYDYIPDFSTLELIKEGSAKDFEKLPDLAGKNEGFGIVFEGTLNIPSTGKYLFETSIDDGGDLLIDGEMVVHNQGEPGIGTERAIIELTEGKHSFMQNYYQEVWSARLDVRVEGPGIEKGSLPRKDEAQATPSWNKREDFEIVVGDEPELIRAFVDHFEKKKTHILNVGTREGVHYSYDTRNNQLNNIWKGSFADVSRMWNNRGETQRLDPLGAELSLEDISIGSNCKANGYILGANGLPTFTFDCDGRNYTDHIQPTKLGSVMRTISLDNGESKISFGKGGHITPLSDGWYSVGHRYFIRPDITNTNVAINDNQFTATITSDKPLKYEIFW